MYNNIVKIIIYYDDSFSWNPDQGHFQNDGPGIKLGGHNLTIKSK